jgi:hypothetical protein
MPETPTDHPLTDQALARLRKLAEGNGLAPEKIELIESQEKVYALEGITRLVPFCERNNARYPGPPRKDRRVVADAGELATEIQRKQEAFNADKDWLKPAMEDLRAAPSQGWGLDGAKITLREKSAALAVFETCPACQGRKQLACENCQGQGAVSCPQCQGRGQELCTICAGTGQNPAKPGTICLICNGRRYIPCRICRSAGRIPCPVCQGRGGVTCSRCNGTGGMTEETVLVCGVGINFKLNSKDLPSGLRRGLDRIGIANLAKGHADIKLIEPEKDKDPDTLEDSDKGSSVTVRYETKLPYADLKVRFGGARAVLVNVFGKRGLLMGVPAFLDQSLKPWRDKLKQAAAGAVPIDDALKARAMRDALALELSGQGQIANLRRLYSVGLSPAAAQDILLDMRRALGRLTRHVRAGAAMAAVLAGSGLLAAFLLLPLHAAMTQSWPWMAGLMLDLAVLALVMGLGWISLGKAAQWVLSRRFPKLKISLHRDTGYIGYGMLLGIFAAWIAILLLAPDRPLWFSYLIGR